jgi:predicted RNA-binding Zn-ribbon protein involved in translation (DUF1610 family)
MWVTARKAQPAPVTAADGILGASQTLHASISQKRRQLHKDRDDTGALRKELKQLKTQIKTMCGRHQIRDKVDALTRARALKELIRRRKTGEDERAFEEKVKPYLDTYRQLNGAEVQGTRGRGTKRLAPPKLQKSIPTKRPRMCVDAGDRKTYEQSSVREEFLNEFEQQAPPLYVVHGDVCERCNVTMIMMGTDSLLGCPTCGQTRIYIQATSSRIAYGEEVEFSSFSYKRLNHFLEWLATFQAKESTVIPEQIIVQVMEELYAQRIYDNNKITDKKVREILKQLKARKCYDHVPQITARITGRLPPRMTPYQEEQVTLMFQAVQGPFDRHCPQDRRNFLSYGYCLFKFCELLGWDKFLPCFSLLKGRDKLRKQDAIYKAICEDCTWEFITSI